MFHKIVPSWNDETARPLAPQSVLMTDVSCDVCVVGGGITGLTAALRLAEAGRDVVLVEASRIGSGATGRSSGLMLTGPEPPLSQLGRFLDKSDVYWLWELALRGRNDMLDLMARHAISCRLQHGVVLAAQRLNQFRRLEQMLNLWQGLGYSSARMLDSTEMRGFADSRSWIGGLYDAGSGHVHPLEYVRALAVVAQGAGVRVFEGTPIDRLEPGLRPMAWCGDVRIRARHMILAANIELTRLVPNLARKVMPTAAAAATTEKLDKDRLRSLLPGGIPVMASNLGRHMLAPTDDNRLMVSVRNCPVRLERPATEAFLRKALLGFFPHLVDLEFDYVWGGRIGVSLNHLPHLGKIGPNSYYALGFSGQGMAMGGMAGGLMAEAITGETRRFDHLVALRDRSPMTGGFLMQTTWSQIRDRW